MFIFAGILAVVVLFVVLVILSRLRDMDDDYCRTIIQTTATAAIGTAKSRTLARSHTR